MDSKMKHLSHDIFTKLSNSSVLLEWYGNAYQCRMLMCQLRSGSRKLWNENLKEWSHKLENVKESIDIGLGDYVKMNKLFKNQRYAMYNITFRISNEAYLRVLYNYLEELKDPSIVSIKKIMICFQLKKQQVIKDICIKLGREDLISQFKEFSFENSKLYYLPSIFEIPEYYQTVIKDRKNIGKLQGPRYIVDGRITYVPEDPAEFTIQISKCNNFTTYYHDFKESYVATKYQFTDFQKSLLENIAFYSFNLSTLTPISDEVVYLKEELGTVKNIHFQDEDPAHIDPELLSCLQGFPHNIKIGNDIPNSNFTFKKGIIVRVFNGITYRFAFENIYCNINNQSKIIYLENKDKQNSKSKTKDDYIFLTSVDEFQGVISKKETNMELLPDLEPILKNKSKWFINLNLPLINDQNVENSLSTFLLVKLDDIEHITLDDPQILVNCGKREIDEIINPGVQFRLEEYPKYDFINKLRNNTSVELNFSTAFTTRNLGKLLDFTQTNYNHLKIISLNSFYFIAEGNLQNLKTFLEKCTSCKKINIRICNQETLLSLLEMLAKTVVMDIHIKYCNDTNEIISDACEGFIRTYFDRNFEIEFEYQGSSISSSF